MQVTINVISGSKQLDQLMRAADLFEEFKRFGLTWAVEMDVERDRFKPEQTVQQLKALLEERGEVVTAIWINIWPHINYVDWSVKAFSTGEKWCILRDYLNAFGVKQPTTDGC